MKQYRLPVTVYQPSEQTQFRYIAEVPALPGCRAWGETASQALANLESIAAEFILSHIMQGHDLPQAAAAQSVAQPAESKLAIGVTVYM